MITEVIEDDDGFQELTVVTRTNDVVADLLGRACEFRIDALVVAAPDNHALGLVGAGPLENHLGYMEENIVWVEDRCRSLPGFITALTTVWGLEDYPDEFVERVERAAGTPFIRRT